MYLRQDFKRTVGGMHYDSIQAIHRWIIGEPIYIVGKTVCLLLGSSRWRNKIAVGCNGSSHVDL